MDQQSECTSLSGPIDDAYFQGQTNTNIHTIFKMVSEIKNDVKEVKNGINGKFAKLDERLDIISSWKNKIIGWCSAISFVFPLVIIWIKEKIFGSK